MRRTRRAVTIAVQTIVIVVMLAAAALFAVPRLLGWQVVTVMSGSMAPAYPIDTVLAIDRVGGTDVRVGDVIAFRTEDDRPIVTHRVVAVETTAGGLTFVTKGDANEDPDSKAVPASNLRGRVVFGVPHIGAFARAMHTTTGFALLFVLPATLLVAQEVLSMRRERRAKRSAEPADGIQEPDEWDEIDRLLGLSHEASR